MTTRSSCRVGGALLLLIASAVSAALIVTLTAWLPAPPQPRAASPSSSAARIYSLITSDDRTYVDALRLLSRSMRAFAPEHGALHVLVTDDVSPAIVREIEAFAVIARVVPAYPEPRRPMMYARWIHQLTKFKLWSLHDDDDHPTGMLCYLDADVAFFGEGTLQGIASECARSLSKDEKNKKIRLCGFESDCRNGGGIGRRKAWGMRYMQANAFCLRPDPALFEEIEENVVRPFMRGNLVFYGRSVSTEQDLMNLYFKHQIHYLDCGPISSGRFLHGKSETGWIQWEVFVNGVYHYY
jgi:hypothetical protein